MIENITLAFTGIWSHKLRSFLTMLGIIIGIASIIAIVSTIKGTSEQIKEQLIGSGNNTVAISLYDGDNEYDDSYSMSGQKPPLLTEEQKQEVREVDHVLDATFFYNRSYTYNIYYQNVNFSGGSLYGIDDRYLDTNGYFIRAGRGFTAADYEKYHKVCLLDADASETIFPSENPIGKVIEIGEEPYIVVGVVEKRSSFVPKISTYEQYSMYMSNSNGCVMIPDVDWTISVAFDQPQNLVIRADSTDNMSKAGSDTAKVLNSYIDSKSNYKYKANDVMEQIKNMQQLTESTNSQLVWIAGISLLVGGIGVMNIMLVSVTERTSEIGLKKAIGARKRLILLQFLTEAAVLTSMGGVIGVILGIVLSRVVSNVTGSPTAISIPASVGSVLFSMLIGIVFGLLPSIKAANLNPIDALRSE